MIRGLFPRSRRALRRFGLHRSALRRRRPPSKMHRQVRQPGHRYLLELHLPDPLWAAPDSGPVGPTQTIPISRSVPVGRRFRVIGLAVGFWEPARMVDVTTKPLVLSPIWAG